MPIFYYVHHESCSAWAEQRETEELSFDETDGLVICVGEACPLPNQEDFETCCKNMGMLPPYYTVDLIRIEIVQPKIDPTTGFRRRLRPLSDT